MYLRSCMWTRVVCLLVRFLFMFVGILEVNIDRLFWILFEIYSEVYV